MDIKPNLQMLQPQTPQSTTPVQNHNTAEAPPKQVAQAMDKLSQASRLIAEIRIGADRFLEGLFAAAQPHSSNKPLQLFLKEDATMRQNLQELRSLGRQLEETGVLTDSLRSRSNSWGLHMPLVCPDGAVVAYAWKRQLAGQAGASAVDRTRLALKAFADQKRQFFPHLDDGQSTEPTLKKHHSSQVLPSSHQDGSSICKTLSDVLACLEKEMPNLRVHTYERLDWIKRASSLSTPANENPVETLKEPTYHGLNKLRTGSQVAVGPSKVAVIELLCPSIFRAVVSLHPAGSIDPDAVAFFSPDEGGSHMHARGFSVYHVYKQITEHANMALQHFLGVDSEIALYSLLKWIYSYQTLFTKVCSKCKKLLAMDRNSLLLLPPVLRPYRQLYMMIGLSTQSNSSIKDHDIDGLGAYHVGCLPEKSLPHK